MILSGFSGFVKILDTCTDLESSLFLGEIWQVLDSGNFNMFLLKMPLGLGSLGDYTDWFSIQLRSLRGGLFLLVKVVEKLMILFIILSLVLISLLVLYLCSDPLTDEASSVKFPSLSPRTYFLILCAFFES